MDNVSEEGALLNWRERQNNIEIYCNRNAILRLKNEIVEKFVALLPFLSFVQVTIQKKDGIFIFELNYDVLIAIFHVLSKISFPYKVKLVTG
jgi:hypothetical protein